ncbi:hypothetical protein Taro_007130 [Colocasia esculenta]|uniref:protein-serine/threonine phosphatase n=1 Tax=Colocasia esculenta TaxID=4460 RepID=A0A843TUK9_COLES|nr:hypothetical protein [Colocasia esculenta]
MAAATMPSLPQVVSRRDRDGGLRHGLPVAPQERFLKTDEAAAPAKRLRTGGVGDVGPRAAVVMPEKKEKRLVLVLDLDHTLLHTTPALRLAPGEAYLLRRPPPPLGQRTLFDLRETHGILTKLRPFVRTFLREAGAMYDLRICTKGNSAYAHRMTRLLDPEGSHFSPGDIVAREDFREKDKKSLDVVPGGDERVVVILDDTVDVWENHLDNLVRVRPYGYFAFHGRPGEKSFAEARLDEEEAAGALAKSLDLLRRAHEMFLDLGAGGDVREVLRCLREKPELRAPRHCS